MSAAGVIVAGYAARWEMARSTGTVRLDRRPNGRTYWFVDVYCEGRRHKIRRVPVYGGGWMRITSEESAHEALGAIRDAIRNGKTPTQAIAPFLGNSSQLVFGKRWDAFVESKRRQGQHSRQLSSKRVDELASYRRRGYLEPIIDLPVHTITYGTLEDWVGWIFDSKKLAPKSVWNVVRDVGTFLNWLERRGDLPQAPELPTIRVPEHAPRIPSATTQSDIIQAIPWADRGLFLARGYMGLRPSEARRALARDWDFDARTLTVRAKGHRFRVLPADDLVAEWVEQHVERQGVLSGALLFARKNGKPWSDSSARRAWERACKAVGAVDSEGLPLFKPNEGLRHAFGTHAVNRGVTLDRAGAFMGHTNPKTTKRYAKLATESLVDVLRRD